MPQEPTPSHSSHRFREDNSNWRGGRSIASNGYVLVRVGVDQPMADCRGYAYEHRLVASKMIGRPIAAGEIVHHKNGIKTDNRPENLEVCAGIGEHLIHHRVKGFDRRMPGEPNPLISCSCGCGTMFPKFDPVGRPREFVSGHNPPKSPVADAILSALAKMETATNGEISEATGLSPSIIKVTLSKLKSQGRINHVSQGLWSRKEG